MLRANAGLAVVRHAHSAIHDPLANGVILFCGSDGSINRNELFELDVCGGPGLRLLPAIGTPPTARNSHVALYDPVRTRMIVVGGNDGAAKNDVHVLDLGTDPPEWHVLNPQGTAPSGRYGHSAIYDPIRDRVIVFGGFDGNAFLNDLWELSLSGTPAWAELTPSGTPPSIRDFHSAIYDPMRDRMVVFGGYDGAPLNDLWALPFSGPLEWVQLFPGGTPPSARHSASLILDPVRNRLVIFGGIGTSSNDESWELPLTEPLAWAPLSPVPPLPIPRHGHTAVYDPLNDRMLVSAGVTAGGLDAGYRADCWVLRWDGVVLVERPHPTGLSFEGLWPNPSADRPLLVFTLPARSRVQSRLFDVSGRLIDRLDMGTLPRGTHRVPADRVSRLPPGMYLVQLETDFGVLRRMWARLR